MNTRLLFPIWSRLLAGWADHLDPSGANLLIDGVHNHADANGSFEGTTRMMWALGGWLSQPDRTAIVEFRNRTFDIEQLTTRALQAGTDPGNPGYWGDPASTGMAQHTVDAAQVAWAVWQSRSRVWSHLDRAGRDRVLNWLIACGHPPEQRWSNNWALFWALNHTVRKAMGLPFDAGIIEDVMFRYLDDAYCGNGWYDDGPQRGTNHFDDYNLWVFASHVLAWCDIERANSPDRVAELLERVRRLMGHMPYLFAADGAWPEHGRSGAYKFARAGAMIWAYRQGAWPHSAGLLRTIVERHVLWYVRRGAIRADGTLRQALTSTGSPAIREPYISTGASYWAMQAFGALWSLPDDDPFWTASPEPLPVEQGDVHQVFAEPGWIITGTRESGHIHRFSLHATKAPEKYGKMVYSTAAPYNAGLAHGLPTPDAMIAITNGKQFSHRSTNEMAELHPQGWLRYRHQHQLGDVSALFETVIIPDGDLHLRIHRLVRTGDGEPIQAVEGAAALGFDDGVHPALIVDRGTNTSGGVTIDHAVVMRGWDQREARLPRSFGVTGRENVVFGNNVIPYLAGQMAPGDLALTTVFLGSAKQVSGRALAKVVEDRPELDIGTDHLMVSWRGKRLELSLVR